MSNIENTYWIIPSFNEGESLLGVCADLQERGITPDRIVLVDDGSTSGVLSKESTTPSDVIVIRHFINLGQGAALQTGIDYALSVGADFLVTFDADGQHDVSDALAMLERLEVDGSLECVIGSRFLGQAVDMPTSRKLTLKLGILFTYFVTGHLFSDVHNGLRVFRSNFFKHFSFSENRMEHASEILEYLARNKHLFDEHAVTIRYTNYSLEKGQSSGNAIRIAAKTILNKLTQP